MTSNVPENNLNKVMEFNSKTKKKKKQNKICQIMIKIMETSQPSRQGGKREWKDAVLEITKETHFSSLQDAEGLACLAFDNYIFNEATELH